MLKKILVAIDDGETDGHILCEAVNFGLVEYGRILPYMVITLPSIEKPQSTNVYAFWKL